VRFNGRAITAVSPRALVVGPNYPANFKLESPSESEFENSRTPWNFCKAVKALVQQLEMPFSVGTWSSEFHVGSYPRQHIDIGASIGLCFNVKQLTRQYLFLTSRS